MIDNATPIVLWLHVRLSGPGINTGHAAGILLEQIEAIRRSGLLAASDGFHVGVSEMDFGLAQRFLPACTLELFECEKRGELPTLSALQKWVQNAPAAYVFYSHLKCCTRADTLCAAWRRCMTHHLIHGWRNCVSALNLGYDSVGCHWMTPEEHPGRVKAPYWGGNFWAAKSDFLKTLPALPDHAANKELYYLSESWIGLGPRRPRVRDAHHVWPNPACGQLQAVPYSA